MNDVRRKPIIAIIFLTMALLLASCGGNTNAENGQDSADVLLPDNPYSGNPNNPIATIEMENGGKVQIELYPELAPNTVKNFVSLAQNGYYDGLIFHRVIAKFMIQGGDPLGNGTGGPGYAIRGEFTNNGHLNDLSHTRGVISMARRGDNMDSAGSQFFIMVADTPQLDGDYAAFGKVISGMKTVDEIAAVKVNRADRPEVDQRIKKVTIDTKGQTIGEPEKITL